jgi:hypothetical protein
MRTDGGNSWGEITGSLSPTYWTNALVVDWRFSGSAFGRETRPRVFFGIVVPLSWWSWWKQGQFLLGTFDEALQVFVPLWRQSAKVLVDMSDSHHGRAFVT